MKLIGAGLPRTATTTQLIALGMLGLPCYHMRDMMADLATSVPQWRRAFEGDGPWDEIFDGRESVVDWPGSYHWRELMDVYPDAKVLLSVRSPEGWVESMHNTIAAVRRTGAIRGAQSQRRQARPRRQAVSALGD